MNFKKLSWMSLALLTLVFAFSSCSKDDDGPSGAYVNGVFISNEGAFNNDNSSVSFYSYDGDSVINGIYKTVNNKDLGDVLQSITVDNGKAFLSVNNSGKVVIVDANTFENIATVPVTLPRHVEVSKNYAYVSSWDLNGAVFKVDLNSYAVVDTALVDAGAENLKLKDSKIYVASSGGYGSVNTVAVIDKETMEVSKKITVGDSPKDLVFDRNGKLWVLSHGKITYNQDWTIAAQTPSQLDQIDPSIDAVVQTITLFDDQHPSHLEINENGDELYFGGGYGFAGIYKMGISSTTATKISDDYAYGFNYDNKSRVLFVGLAPTFTENGTIKRISTDGQELGSYTVGIGPNGISVQKDRKTL